MQPGRKALWPCMTSATLNFFTSRGFLRAIFCNPCFARKDEQSGRVVAFAVADNYLILGTREDLVAGSLELMSGSKGRTVSQEGWYTQALAAAQTKAGDLRMALNMEKIAVTPHFRTYWIQQNITEMQSYGSAIADLYRDGATYREERVILPKKQADEAV